MENWRSIILAIHLVAMFFMAAPLYMLIIVNERARFGLPPGYNTDRYMENIIKKQPIRCYAYLGVILATGLLLIWITGRGWTALFTDWTLLIKVVTFILLTGFLSYIHFGVQPKIERVLSTIKPDSLLPDSEKPKLVVLRTRRKRFSGLCLFLVLTALLAGTKLTLGLTPLIFFIFVALSALFAYRAYKVPIPKGWF
ncbi:MAG: hypothetical protein ACXWMS_08980 [Syntrophales bacterium]